MKKMSFVRNVVIAIVVIGAAAAALKIKDAYFDNVTMVQVPIEGAPCLNGRLDTVIAIRADFAGGFTQISYSGGLHGAGMRAVAPEFSLKNEGVVELKVRIGPCRSGGRDWDCGHVAFPDDYQVVRVDTSAAHPTVKLMFPRDMACQLLDGSDANLGN